MGSTPSGMLRNVMKCHVPAAECHVLSCRAVSAGLSARSSSRAAARVSAVGVGFGHACLLPGKGRDGMSLFCAPLRGRACGGAGGRIAAARFARVIARARRADAPRPSVPAGVFFAAPAIAFCRKAERRPPGSRLSLLSFYTISPNVKHRCEQKKKVPVETRPGSMPWATASSRHASPRPGPVTAAAGARSGAA